MKFGLCVAMALRMAASAASPAKTEDNPQPLEGDLIIPMPGGREMAFRPVALGVGAQPLASREFTIGDRTGQYLREGQAQVSIGASFVLDVGGKPDTVFYLGKYEVSDAQFTAVSAPGGSASQLPKVNVTRAEIEGFIDSYNDWLGKNARARMPKRDSAVGSLRLPTEAEWEFAARGGSLVAAERFERCAPYEGSLSEYEWFGGPRSSHDKLKAIGLLKPGPLGLHDMLGNAAEFTETRYEVVRGSGQGGGYTIRGGNFRNDESEIRASFRFELPERDRGGKRSSGESIGFRLMIAAPVVTDENAASLNPLSLIKIPRPKPQESIVKAAPSDETNARILEKMAAIEEQLKKLQPQPPSLVPASAPAPAFAPPAAALKAPMGLDDFFQQVWKHQFSNDALDWSGDFAESVSYCYKTNGSADRRFITDDRQKLIQRFPVRRYSLDHAEDPVVNSSGEVQLNYRFSYEYGGKKNARGASRISMTVKQIAGRWQIVRFDEGVANNAGNSVPQPKQVPQPEQPAGRSPDGIDNFFKSMFQHQASNDAGVWAGDFASSVAYCYKSDGRASRNFIADDRTKVIKRYPNRTYRLEEVESLVPVSPTEARIVYRYNYSYSGQKNASGRARTSLTTTLIGGTWQITRFDESVIRN